LKLTMAHHASANPNHFILPDLGEGVAEAELIKWRVSVGQVVNEHDILADMETDKALVEVPSPRAGRISALNGSEGDIIKVGAVLVEFGEAAPAPAPAHATAPKPVPSNAQAEPPCDMGSQIASKVPTQTASSNGHHAPESSGDAGTVVGSVGGTLAGLASDGKALATPAVRRIARELGVDIDTVAGSGIGGRVTENDVRDAASATKPSLAGTQAPLSTPPARRASAPAPAPVAQPPAAPSRPAPPPAFTAPTPTPSQTQAPRKSDAEIIAAVTRPAAPAPAQAPASDTQRIPFRGVRRTIANRLKESVTKTVHFTVMDEAEVSALDVLRKKLALASGEKVSFLPFVASAVARCLASEFSAFNATTDEASEEILRHRAIHLGIATDTESGLMVPVVRDCEKLGVLEIGRAITAAAEGARTRTAAREALSGSTFTISNVGSHAGRFATPIINYPEVGILAVGRARDGVVVKSGAIAVGKLLPLSLACDHRVVDGAAAALMLAKIIDLLGRPEELLGPARP
jgi:pyruvate dehydrogenase E2 component (dihydrolipoamide acetyltransferase)